MGVQRYSLPSGAVRYRARVKWHGRYVATRVFERKADAVAWEQDQQRRRLRLGEWIDPRRGQVPLWVVAGDWLGSRGSVKRRTRETDEADGEITCSRVSAIGPSRQSRRRRCRTGSALWWPAA